MREFIIVLYVLAGLLSLWGAIGPWLRRRRRKAFLERAVSAAQRVRELEEKVMVLSDANGESEAEQPQLSQQLNELRAAKFEDSDFTLTQLTSPVLFGNTPPAQKELQELSARKEGLGWLAAGVVVGSVASILSIVVL